MPSLTKFPIISYSPGTPFVPADPGAAAAPGYYRIDSVVVTYPVYGWVSNGGSGSDFKIIGYTSATQAVSVWVAPVLYRAPTPAGAAQPGVVSDLSIGWNSGADTIAAAVGDANFTFSIPASSVGVVVGLSNTSAGGDYKTILHGVYASHGSLLVIEAGVIVGYPQAFGGADVIGVQRRGSAISYTRNGIVFQSSVAATQDTVFGTAALYLAGDSVVAAAFTPLAGAASAIVTMAPLTGSAFVGTYSQSATSLIPLAANGGGHQLVGMVVALQPLVTLAANQAIALSATALAPLTGSGSAGLLAPVYAASYASMAYLLSASHGLSGGNGTSAAMMLPATSIAADHPYGTSFTTLEAMTGRAGIFTGANTLDVTVPMATVLAYGGANAHMTLPMATVRATAHDSTGENAFVISLPMATVQAQGGANARMAVPMATLAATGTVTGLAQINATLPMAQVEATGTVSAMAKADIAIPMATVIGYGGAVCSVTIGMATVDASGTTGGIGKIVATLPLFQVTATGTAQNHGSFSIVIPMARLGGPNALVATIPMATLTAIGTAVVAVSHEAYSFNLSHKPRQPGQDPAVDEATRYTNFPFDRILRYQGSYFGVAADGLYLLEGTLDAGTAIPYAVKTCLDDFGAPEKKTIDAAFFGGRLGPGAAVTLTAGEVNAQTYAFTTPRGQLAQNYRQKFGKGVKHRYFALGVADTGVMELDTLELETNKLTRKI